MCSVLASEGSGFLMQLRASRMFVCLPETGSNVFGASELASTASGSTTNGGSAFDGETAMPMKWRSSIITRSG